MTTQIVTVWTQCKQEGQYHIHKVEKYETKRDNTIYMRELGARGCEVCAGGDEDVGSAPKADVDEQLADPRIGSWWISDDEKTGGTPEESAKEGESAENSGSKQEGAGNDNQKP